MDFGGVMGGVASWVRGFDGVGMEAGSVLGFFIRDGEKGVMVEDCESGRSFKMILQTIFVWDH